MPYWHIAMLLRCFESLLESCYAIDKPSLVYKHSSRKVHFLRDERNDVSVYSCCPFHIFRLFSCSLFKSETQTPQSCHNLLIMIHFCRMTHSFSIQSLIFPSLCVLSFLYLFFPALIPSSASVPKLTPYVGAGFWKWLCV